MKSNQRNVWSFFFAGFMILSQGALASPVEIENSAGDLYLVSGSRNDVWSMDQINEDLQGRILPTLYSRCVRSTLDITQCVPHLDSFEPVLMATRKNLDGTVQKAFKASMKMTVELPAVRNELYAVELKKMFVFLPDMGRGNSTVSATATNAIFAQIAEEDCLGEVNTGFECKALKETCRTLEKDQGHFTGDCLLLRKKRSQ